MTSDPRSSRTVIVVDPNPSDYIRLARWIRQAGMCFYHLPTGQDALRAATGVSVDLWIINVELPDMSGFELVERLQPRRRCSDVFLVSNHYQKEDENRALSLGVTMYLCKPARPFWLRNWRPRPDRAPREETRESREAHVMAEPPSGHDDPFA